MVTSVLFDPIKNWTQERIDKFFYRKRYDYRKTLIEFGRELNSERDLGKMLDAILERIQRTLLVDRMAVFLADRGPARALRWPNPAALRRPAGWI